MDKKQIKFAAPLAALIQDGEKTCTWRLFDDKNLTLGDEVIFINSDTKTSFGSAVLTVVRTKLMKDVDAEDFDGHEPFSTEEEMYKVYRSYYGDRVGPDTEVKIIHFAFTS